MDISGRQIEWNCLCFSSSLCRLLCAKVRIAIPGCRDRGADTGLVCFLWDFLHRSACGKGEGVLSPNCFPRRLLLLFPSPCHDRGRRDAHTCDALQTEPTSQPTCSAFPPPPPFLLNLGGKQQNEAFCWETWCPWEPSCVHTHPAQGCLGHACVAHTRCTRSHITSRRAVRLAEPSSAVHRRRCLRLCLHADLWHAT